MSNDQKWKANCWSCFDLFPLCLFSLLCPCITQGISAWELSQEGGCGQCLIVCYCCCIGMALNRSSLRNNYEIKGNCIADCLLFSCCCYSCMATQEYLHVNQMIKERKERK